MVVVANPTIHQVPTVHPVAEESELLSEQDEFERFNEFLIKLRDSEEPVEKFQHAGIADFLKYQLGHLKGSMFETWSENSKLYREIKDYPSNTTIYMVPFLCERPCLLLESRLVNDKGKPVNISYKEVNEKTPTTESYPFHPGILKEGHPKHFTISKGDLVKGFSAIREEIKRKIIAPISQVTGYKWVYSKSSYRDRVYFLEFNCFQDCKKDMNPSKFKNKNLTQIFEIQDCMSSIHIGIHIFSKKYIISYQHKQHSKLIDIVYSILAQILNENQE